MNIEIRLDYGVISAVLLGLLLFGIGYNSLVAWMQRRGYAEGYLGLIVALGVLVTLCGVAILSIQAALITLAAFIASGTPMIAGSILRYVNKRDAMKRAILEELHDKTA